MRIKTVEEIRKMIRKVRHWEHTINLCGVLTPGRITQETHDWVARCLPADLRGKRVLDIGAWDGYYSFLCEQRGAKVLAIDISPKHREGFDVAKEILHSQVDYRIMSVYDIGNLGGMFDHVLFFGVIYHLLHPILALQKIREKCKGELFLESSYIITQSSTGRFVWTESKDPTMYWRFSATCLKRMCKLADFRDVKVITTKWYFPLRRGRILMKASV